jgi:hypothetical protein
MPWSENGKEAKSGGIIGKEEMRATENYSQNVKLFGKNQIVRLYRHCSFLNTGIH